MPKIIQCAVDISDALKKFLNISVVNSSSVNPIHYVTHFDLLTGI